LDQLDADGLVITKHGKPVARVLPYDSQDADLIGSLKHKITIRGDIFSTGVRWNVDAQS
jgi:antitoxin (DNA-binding transcriptional repressor) of toxin-antitoxin stability system